MIKGSHVIIITALLILCLPLFVPYMQYDIPVNEDNILDLGPQFFGRLIFEKDYILLGSKTRLSYFPLIWSLIPFFIYMRKRSKGSLLAFFILSVVLVVIMLILYFAFTAEPSFYYGYENVRPLIGFWFGVVGAVLLTIATFQEWMNTMREEPAQKRERSRSSHGDLLDDSI